MRVSRRVPNLNPILTIAILLLVGGCLAPSLGTGGDAVRYQPQKLVPRRYQAPRTLVPINVDGRPDDAAWQSADWTEPFLDIQGPSSPRPTFNTRAKILWDDSALYIAAALEEPHVWASLTEHDAIVFHDNDFEVFIDPDGDGRSYFEIEINAVNTIFDLYLTRPYLEGGPAHHDWNAEGLRTAVAIDGTLNDPRDQDGGWTVEMAVPWRAFGADAHVPLPPHAGAIWRVNFSRVQWRHQIIDGKYVKVPDTPEDNWVWSPQGVIDMHLPWLWGYVTFLPGPSE